MKKTLLAAALLATCLSGASCQGPNKLFSGLGEWNADVTKADWSNTAIFWGLHIIPVYEVAYLVDVVVTNPIEYWGKDGDGGGDE